MNRKRKSTLGNPQAKGDSKGTAIGTARDLLVGAGSAVVGAGLGRLSLFTGIIALAGGHYADSPTLKVAGLGMILANGYDRTNSGEMNQRTSADGKFDFKTEIDNGKARVGNFVQSFSHKLYLDSLMKKKGPPAPPPRVNEFADTQIDPISGLGSADLYTLDHIEQTLMNSASEFEHQGNIIPSVELTIIKIQYT